jgi:hypothetical protein
VQEGLGARAVSRLLRAGEAVVVRGRAVSVLGVPRRAPATETLGELDEGKNTSVVGAALNLLAGRL